MILNFFYWVGIIRFLRNGEILGVDYVFFFLEEFVRLERSGSFFESGIYEGNYYGILKLLREFLLVDNMIFVSVKGKVIEDKERLRIVDNFGLLLLNWEVVYIEDNVKYFIE